MEITYRENENFYVPNLLMPEEEPATYGRFGRIRLKYLKEPQSSLYKFKGLRPIDTSSQWNRPWSKRNAAAADRADSSGAGHHGADESCWPTDMGRGNEQYPQHNGGNCVKWTDLLLIKWKTCRSNDFGWQVFRIPLLCYTFPEYLFYITRKQYYS